MSTESQSASVTRSVRAAGTINVSAIRPLRHRKVDSVDGPLSISNAISDDAREIAVSYLKRAITSLSIYAAALGTSKCEIAQAVGKRLNFIGLQNEIDIAREIIELGDEAIRLSGARRQV